MDENLKKNGGKTFLKKKAAKKILRKNKLDME